MKSTEVHKPRIDDNIYRSLSITAKDNKLTIGDVIFTICSSVISKKTIKNFYYPRTSIPYRQVRFNTIQTEFLEEQSKIHGVPIAVLIYTTLVINLE